MQIASDVATETPRQRESNPTFTKDAKDTMFSCEEELRALRAPRDEGADQPWLYRFNTSEPSCPS